MINSYVTALSCRQVRAGTAQSAFGDSYKLQLRQVIAGFWYVWLTHHVKLLATDLGVVWEEGSCSALPRSSSQLVLFLRKIH